MARKSWRQLSNAVIKADCFFVQVMTSAGGHPFSNNEGGSSSNPFHNNNNVMKADPSSNCHQAIHASPVNGGDVDYQMADEDSSSSPLQMTSLGSAGSAMTATAMTAARQQLPFLNNAAAKQAVLTDLNQNETERYAATGLTGAETAAACNDVKPTLADLAVLSTTAATKSPSHSEPSTSSLSPEPELS